MVGFGSRVCPALAQEERRGLALLSPGSAHPHHTLTLTVCSLCRWSSLCGASGSHQRGPEGGQITGVQPEQSLRGHAVDRSGGFSAWGRICLHLHFSPAGYPFFSIPRKLQHDLKIPFSGPQQYLLEVGASVKEQIDCE